MGLPQLLMEIKVAVEETVEVGVGRGGGRDGREYGSGGGRGGREYSRVGR